VRRGQIRGTIPRKRARRHYVPLLLLPSRGDLILNPMDPRCRYWTLSPENEPPLRPGGPNASHIWPRPAFFFFFCFFVFPFFFFFFSLFFFFSSSRSPDRPMKFVFS